MIYSNEYVVGIEQTGFNNLITNKGILSIMEDIASLHSAEVGYGLLDIEKIRRGWILLDWQIKVMKRPLYNEKLSVSTWSRGFEKACAYRDYEFKNQSGEVVIIGTSRWILFDIDKRRPLRLTEDITSLYDSETEFKVFKEDIKDIAFDESMIAEVKGQQYKVMRRDIDINNHMHNINYLEVAFEALPEDVYKKIHFENLRIQYKREIKYGDMVECRYFESEGYKAVAMLVEGRVHAIVAMK